MCVLGGGGGGGGVLIQFPVKGLSPLPLSVYSHNAGKQLLIFLNEYILIL